MKRINRGNRSAEALRNTKTQSYTGGYLKAMLGKASGAKEATE